MARNDPSDSGDSRPSVGVRVIAGRLTYEDVVLFDDLGVCRVELDLPPAGLRRRDPAALPGSLWWPHVLVAVSRFCVAALAEDLAARQPGRVWPCQRSCRQTLVALRHPAMPGPLWSRGPAQHWENPGELPDLRALSVDRVVELPEVPF